MVSANHDVSSNWPFSNKSVEDKIIEIETFQSADWANLEEDDGSACQFLKFALTRNTPFRYLDQWNSAGLRDVVIDYKFQLRRLIGWWAKCVGVRRNLVTCHARRARKIREWELEFLQCAAVEPFNRRPIVERFCMPPHTVCDWRNIR